MGFFISILAVVPYLFVLVCVVWLGFRFVRAVERIADNLGNPGPPSVWQQPQAPRSDN